MAKMYPPQPVNSNSGAERRLFNIFKDKLSPEFHVYHSRWWQFPHKLYGSRDTETDFLIAHPSLRLMVIEVKGGKISYDSSNDTWLTYGHKIKNPYKQARNNIHSLFNFLKSTNLILASKRYTYKYCVAFPDVDQVKNLPQDGKRRTLTSVHLDDIENQLVKIFNLGPKEQDGLGEEGLRELFNIVSPPTKFEYFDINEIERNKLQVNQLTEKQYYIFLELAEFKQVVILGCAGSGKTQLALAKAKQLASKQKLKTLVMCKSFNLAGYLYLQLKDFIINCEGKLKVCRFSKLADEIRNNLGKNFKNISDVDILKNYSMLLNSKFDAIIIDEGQDFDIKELDSIKELLVDRENSWLYIFQDDNQNVYQKKLHTLIKIYPRNLVKNLRNTNPIFNSFKRYVSNQERLISSGNPGPIVKKIEYFEFENLIVQIQEELSILLDKNPPINPNLITLLTNKKSGSSIFNRISIVNNIPVRKYDVRELLNSPSKCIRWLSVKEFKGLENSIIFFVREEESGFIPSSTEIHDNYIAQSRAKWLLIIFEKTNNSEV